MSKRRRRTTLGAVAAAASLAAVGSAGAQAVQTEASGRPVPVKEAFPYLDAYLNLPASERSLFTAGYYLRRGGAPAQGVEAAYVGPSGRHRLTVGSDGRMLPLPTRDELRSAHIEFHAPPGPEFGVAMKPLASLKSAVVMNASEVARAIVQADAGMHKAAGMKAIFLPRLVRAVFVDAGSGSSIAADGRETPLPGGARPYYEPSTLPGAVSLKFMRPPSAVLLHSADDKRS